eukprot:9181156-Prorocentrum_lima.AAC.1
MTSTLVGSEMCIRDRSLTSARCIFAPPRRCQAQRHFRSWYGLGIVPVSYTHLTLPTICSV